MDPLQQHPQGRPFWRDMGPAGHACHLYTDDAQLVEVLAQYVGGALWNDEAVVLVATEAHLQAIESRLRLTGLDLAHFRAEGRYVALPAGQTLSRLLDAAGRIDETCFDAVIGETMRRAAHGGKPVRAFGEMVSILWTRGEYTQALVLEALWNRLLAQGGYRLICAYFQPDFIQADARAIEGVHAAHTHVSIA